MGNENEWKKAKIEFKKYVQKSLNQDGKTETLKETYRHLLNFFWFGKWKILYFIFEMILFYYGIREIKNIFIFFGYHIKFIQLLAILIVLKFTFSEL